MSSHHFVRENQEPAVILHCIDDFQYSRLSDLLEWAPKIICTDTAANQALALGVKIDVLISDDVDTSAEVERKMPVERLATNGDELSTALNYLSRMKAIGAYIITKESIAEVLINKTLPFAKLFDLEVLEKNARLMICRKSRWKKWIAGNGEYEVISMVDGTKISTQGFVENFDTILNQSIGLCYQGEGFVSISSSQTPFLIKEIISD